MKKALFTFSLLIFLSALCLAAENYKVDINGNTYEIELDKQKNIVLSDGTKLKIQLSLKEYFSFDSQLFSFSYKNIHNPIKNDMGDGIYQTLIMTHLGTAITIEEYTDINPPSKLIDLVIKNLTEEEVANGYKYEEKEVVKMVGKTKIKGKEVITTYKNEKWTRSVYVYGKANKGILIMSQIEETNIAAEKNLIDDFWKTLNIKL